MYNYAQHKIYFPQNSRFICKLTMKQFALKSLEGRQTHLRLVKMSLTDTKCRAGSRNYSKLLSKEAQLLMLCRRQIYQFHLRKCRVNKFLKSSGFFPLEWNLKTFELTQTDGFCLMRIKNKPVSFVKKLTQKEVRSFPLHCKNCEF